jgi:hypothetical protein
LDYAITQVPKLLDQVRETIRIRHYSIRTEKSYVSWIRQYILFQAKKLPREIVQREVGSFLPYLASQRYAWDLYSRIPKISFRASGETRRIITIHHFDS